VATLREIEEAVVRFRDQRDWAKYHTPRNLAISLVVEVGELLELLQWKTDGEILEYLRQGEGKAMVSQELADVAIYLLLLAHELGVDLEQAILEKLKLNEQRYPAEKVKGRYVKYTALQGEERRSPEGSGQG